MLFDYLRLAVRNVRKRGLRSWLTMLGIFIGIAAVVSLISLSQGLESAILGQFGSLDPDKLIVENAATGFGPPGSTAVQKLTDHDLELIETVAGVERAIPRLIRQVSLEYNDVRIFRTVADVPSDEEDLEVVYDSLNAGAEEGRMLTSDDRGKVVLGNDFLTTDIFDKRINVGSTILVQGEAFEVIGFLEKAGTFILNDALLISHDDLVDITGIDDEIDMIVVQVEDQDRIEQVATSLEERLRRDRNLKEGEDDFSVKTPLQSLSAITTVLNVIGLTVSGIAAISLLIGGIGIANTMFTSVLERRKEIGVMKAVGAQNRDVMTLFVIESSLLGLAGGIIGTILGLSLAYAIASLAGAFLGGIGLDVSISWPLVIGAISLSLILGIIFGLIPCWQASRLRPVEALRT